MTAGPEVETRVCWTCGLSKPLLPHFWNRHEGSAGGYRRHCKVCWNKRASEWERARRRRQTHTSGRNYRYTQAELERDLNTAPLRAAEKVLAAHPDLIRVVRDFDPFLYRQEVRAIRFSIMNRMEERRQALHDSHMKGNQQRSNKTA